MQTLQRIAVVLNYEVTWGRGVLHGVARYAAASGTWAILRRPNQEAIWGDVRDWRPDGIIAEMHIQADVDRATSLDVPIVSLSAPVIGRKIPRVGFDDRMVGTLAARHFADLGLHTVTYAGTAVWPNSRDRELGLRMTAADLGLSMVPGFDFGVSGPRRMASMGRLRDWVRQLPAGVGVLCFNDEAAGRVAEACLMAGVRVPTEVAILGVDDDALLCETMHPPLSSVRMPLEDLGFAAAQLLDMLLAGHVPDTQTILLPPAGVMARASTNTLAPSLPFPV